MIKTTLLLAWTLLVSYTLVSQTPCDLDNTPPVLPTNPFFSGSEDCFQFPDIASIVANPDVSVLSQATSTVNAHTLYDVEIIPMFADYKAIVLFTISSEYKYYDMDEAYLIDRSGDQLSLVAKVHNRVHPNGGFYLVFNFENGRNWADWSALNRGFKADLNGLDNEHENWMYYEFGDCQGFGWGDMTGSTLNFTHSPSSYYYGFQVGLGANNNSAEYGCGGWFFYTGTIVDNATGFSFTQANPIGSAGDVTFNMIPEATSLVQVEYSAADACGNTSVFSMCEPLCEAGAPVLNNIPLNTSVSTLCDVINYTPIWSTACENGEVTYAVNYSTAPANNGSTQIIVTATYTATTTCSSAPMEFTAHFTINPSDNQTCSLPGLSMDIDNNLVVGTNDIVLFMSTPSETMEYDFNLSGTQDVNDLLMIIQNFGETAP